MGSEVPVSAGPLDTLLPAAVVVVAAELLGPLTAPRRNIPAPRNLLGPSTLVAIAVKACSLIVMLVNTTIVPFALAPSGLFCSRLLIWLSVSIVSTSIIRQPCTTVRQSFTRSAIRPLIELFQHIQKASILPSTRVSLPTYIVAPHVSPNSSNQLRSSVSSASPYTCPIPPDITSKFSNCTNPNAASPERSGIVIRGNRHSEKGLNNTIEFSSKSIYFDVTIDRFSVLPITCQSDPCLSYNIYECLCNNKSFLHSNEVKCVYCIDLLSYDITAVRPRTPGKQIVITS